MYVFLYRTKGNDGNNMINNVIFDIGRVLVHYNWKKWLEEILTGDDYADFLSNRAKKQGLPCDWISDDTDVLIDKLFNAIFASGEWDEIDRGLLPVNMVIERMASHVEGGDYKPLIDYCMHNCGCALEQYDYARSWIWNIKAKGFGVFYLSNYSRFIMEQNMECLDFVPMMNGGIFSDDVKLIKPDPLIYELLCERYCLIPKECVFIDDKPENVEAAVSLGFHGIIMKDYDQASVELNKLLV